MGQKTNPIGNRLGIIRGWDSNWYGGRDYGDSQFNRVTQAQRQPGSAFKIFVYLAGLDNGYAPDDLMVDSEININGWSPKNYKKEYLGEIQLDQAFSKSINTIAVKLSENIGRESVIKMAKSLKELIRILAEQ